MTSLTLSNPVATLERQLVPPLKFIAFDIEATGLGTVRGDGNIHCYSLVNDTVKECYEWDSFGKVMLSQYLGNDYILVCHSAQYDIASVNSLLGLNLTSANFRCTQVLAHAINNQRGTYSLDSLTGEKIDYCAEMVAAGYATNPKDKAFIYALPFNPIMRRYNLQDAQLTWDLWKSYQPHLEKDARLRDSYENILNPFVEVIMSMHGGMNIDATAMMTLLQEVTAELNILTSQFILDYPRCAKLKWDKDAKQWNATGKVDTPSLTSPNDVTSLLFAHGWVPDDYKKDTGRPVTSKAVLERLVATETTAPSLEKLARGMLGIKSLIGIQTQCITLLTLVATTKSPIIHVGWHQTGTVTHRLSSSPNLQNISVRHPRFGAKMRSCFTPPPGYVMMVGDLSQIELAILAYYLELFMGDSDMADAVRAGKDLHSANTENWKGISPDSPTFKKERAICKNGIFATSYGAAAQRLSLTLNCSLSEAQEILRTVEGSIPIVALKKLFWSTTAMERDIVPISHGYRKYKTGVFYDVMGTRHFYPNITSEDRYLKTSAERQTFNSLMQGGCASVFFSLCNKLLPHLAWGKGWICSTVHDECILYVKQEYADELLVTANKVFSSLVIPTKEGGIPVRADFSIVQNWSQKS